MMRIILLLGFIILVASFPLINNWMSEKTINNGSIDKGAIEAIIENYINENPQKIVDSVLRLQRGDGRQNDAPVDLKMHKEELEDSTYPSVGNKDSKITVVEFFDYSCHYCKIMLADVKQLIADNKVKYIFRDLPILGEGSMHAARGALAVYFINQDKYLDFYYAALEYKDRFTDSLSIMPILKQIGIDEKEFNRSLSDNEEKINSMLQNTYNTSKKLKINGTPSIVVGDSLMVGAVDLNTLRTKITELGKNKI